MGCTGARPITWSQKTIEAGSFSPVTGSVLCVLSQSSMASRSKVCPRSGPGLASARAWWDSRARRAHRPRTATAPRSTACAASPRSTGALEWLIFSEFPCYIDIAWENTWRGEPLLVYWVDRIIFLNFKETYTIFQFYLKEKIVHGKVEHMQIARYCSYISYHMINIFII